ncbi:MAG: hypothetical protein ACYTHK_00365 [Planctomycetota bacterium]|jgi:hypothetical protein
MVRPSVVAMVLALAGTPVLAGIQLVETKKGKIYEAREVLVVGDKLRMSLALKESGQSATVSIPIDTVLPEFVYYAWASQIAEHDVEGHMSLAGWCRKQGLFRQAWREYIAASEASDKIMKRLPELEADMNEEAATWYFTQAEKRLRDGEVHAARVLAERVLNDYPESKEVPRTKGLLMLIKEREQFLSEQKQAEKKAILAQKQRRYVEKQLKQIDSAKTMVRNTRMQNVPDARRRLRWASYTFRRSLHRLHDLVPFIEADDLRTSVEAIVRDTEKNLIASFTRLADLRYLSGDVAGALDAAHEVLWVDPENKAMTDMRKRVLDAGENGRYRFRYGYYDRFILRRHGYLPPFACPYPTRVGFGIHHATPYRVRPVRVRSGTRTLIRYVY